MSRKENGKKKKGCKTALGLLLIVQGCILIMTGCTTGQEAAGKEKAGAVEAGKAALEKENGKSIHLDMGEVKTLPLSEQEELLSCSSNKEKIVSVSQNGVLHGLKQGTARITLESLSEDKRKTRTFQVKVGKRGMVYPVFSMMKGEHLDLQFSLKNVQAVWKSGNPAVAKVTKSGRVLARKKGTALLVAESAQGKRYRCKLKVTKRIKSVIYLTFDDGPNRYSTTKILNILKKNQVKATFFELKPAKKDFDLSKRVLDEGHTLALHGYQHKYDIVYRSQKAYHNNLDQLRDLFFRKFGVWCTVSRFPGGSSNLCSSYNPGIMTRLTGKLHEWGYHYFDWNVDSGDAGSARTKEDTFQNFKRSLIKGRGNVVLMHDYYKNDKTIDALERMIQYGKKNGFTFLPITASTAEVHHRVNN